MQKYREKIENLFFKGLLGDIEHEHDWELFVSYEHIYNRILNLLQITDLNIEITGDEDQYMQANMDYKIGDKLYFIIFDNDVDCRIGDDGIEQSIINNMVDILNAYDKCKKDFPLLFNK